MDNLTKFLNQELLRIYTRVVTATVSINTIRNCLHDMNLDSYSEELSNSSDCAQIMISDLLAVLQKHLDIPEINDI